MNSERTHKGMPGVVIKYAEKNQREAIRALWQEAFADPEVFADYYFEQVYPENRVLVAEKDGQILSMLHLNPYEWKFEMNSGHPVRLHYIVGVATGQEYRRKGLMAECLRRALQDMEQAGEPFTYLMPAKEEYYTPFDFVPVARQRIWEKPDKGSGWILQTAEQSAWEIGEPEQKFEGSVQEAGESEPRRLVLPWKARNYPLRTAAYRRRLEAEMKCDCGGLIEWADSKGYAAYGFEDGDPKTGPVIMQVYMEEAIEEKKPVSDVIEETVCPALYKRYGDCRIRYVEKQPIMLRILNLERFVKLLSYKGDDRIYHVQVRDAICGSNQGRFRIRLSENGCTAVRLSETDETECRLQEIAELTKWLIKDTDFADALYIMEIV
ncbi:MAG: GNAT family N-acetyltransferase [Clostridium sp.]|nr:GNAT family N-acetyltransferase [Clostridium sp.]